MCNVGHIFTSEGFVVSTFRQSQPLVGQDVSVKAETIGAEAEKVKISEDRDNLIAKIFLEILLCVFVH